MSTLATLTEILRPGEGQGLVTYFDELLSIAREWDLDVLSLARQELDLFDYTGNAVVARYVFATEIQHRLHGRPAPTLRGLTDVCTPG